MTLYEMPLSMSLLAFGMLLTNFHMCGIMLLLRPGFKHARGSKRAYVFKV